MKVHTSNYRIIGFTESVSALDLARLAHDHGLPCINDVGSGLFADLAAWDCLMNRRSAKCWTLAAMS